MSKPLKFIHITKCAGTSIENAAKEKGILWGRFHQEYKFWHQVFPKVKDTVINKYDWFTVVRNPYDRILSEYHCKWGGIGSKNPHHTKQQMNAYLIRKINRRKASGDHYTEQYLYLHPTVPIHILKFENLATEFDALMSHYNIQGITLTRENSSTKFFTVSDFSPELIALINRVYDKDFEIFGYTKFA
jgi:hypothetical protein